MSDRRTHRVRGAAIGAIPGVLVFAAGAAIGGEAALSFGVIGIMMVILGLILGAVVGSLMLETLWGKVSAGAIIGAAPGVVFNLLRMGYPAWVNILAVFGGAAVGGGIGYWLSHRAAPGVPAH